MRDLRLSSRIRRLVRNGVAAAGLATGLLVASPAAADAEANVFADAGVFLGYTWGAGGGFTWGLEGRVGADFREPFACTSEAAPAVSGVARLGFVDLDQPYFSLGGQAGVFFGPTSAMADFGLGYRWGENAGLSVPMGLDLQVWAASTMIGVDLTRESGFALGGVRIPPPDRQFGCVVAGRALHDEAGQAALPAVHALAEWRARSEIEREVVSEWGHRARTEWASVPAFLQLADQLARAGAPRALIARALGAADDELRHTVLSARIAMAHGSAPLALDRVTPATRAPVTGLDALRRLAVESWVDGCLGEGKAAAAAASEAEHAGSPSLRDASRTIARDEAAHAELAWDVLDWTVRAGGDEVRHALWAARDARPMEDTGVGSDLDLSAFGLLSEDAHRAIGERVRTVASARLSRVVEG